MKVCPMCTMPQLEKGLVACQFCGYEEKPIEKLSKKELYDLMASYEYERTEDGCRIKAVKNIRDIALRGAVSIPHFVTEIGANAFASCYAMTEFVFPAGITTINAAAFQHMDGAANSFPCQSATVVVT